MGSKANVIPLLGEEWAELLWEEFNLRYMRYIINRLKEDRSKYTVFPSSDKVFRAYKETPYSKVKVCIIGQDPYPSPGDANGLAFSVDRNIDDIKRLPPTLVNIFKELEEDLRFEVHKNIDHNPDLGRWAKQGVMLLNTSLTVIKNNPSSHSDIGWDIFTGRTLRLLAEKENMIFVAWGRHAQNILSHNGNVMTNYFVTSTHPSPLSAHRGFFGSKPFSRINKTLIKIGEQPIKW